MQYTDEKNLPGLALFIDFEKAFDTVNRNFITETLKFFGFGPSLVQRIHSSGNYLLDHK